MLSQPAFDFPPRRRPKQVIRDFLSQSFAELTRLLDSVSEPDKFLEKVCDQRALARSTAESVEQSLVGNQSGAFAALCDLMLPLKEHLDTLSMTSRIGLTYKKLNHPGFFRARRISGIARPARRDLFHVPFEERKKLATQRYSIAGVPCLYLGSSAHVCWEELGRPEFSSTYISHFQAREAEQQLRLLTIGPAPIQLMRRILHPFDSPPIVVGGEDLFRSAAVSLSICWPLIAACSMQILDRGSPFVPEYLIPQLVLQWVLNSTEADGVEYPSMFVDHSQIWSDYGFNYAFPAKSSGRDGFCAKLTTLFEMTDPVPWSLALAFRDAPKGRPQTSATYWMDFGLAGGVRMDYRVSEFGLVEATLRGMERASPES